MNGEGGAKTLFQQVNSMSFMPYTEAAGQLAAKMGVKNGTGLTLQTRGSKFEKYQEVRVQEISSQASRRNGASGATLCRPAGPCA